MTDIITKLDSLGPPAPFATVIFIFRTPSGATRRSSCSCRTTATFTSGAAPRPSFVPEDGQRSNFWSSLFLYKAKFGTSFFWYELILVQDSFDTKLILVQVSFGTSLFRYKFLLILSLIWYKLILIWAHFWNKLIILSIWKTLFLMLNPTIAMHRL